ncbi:antibiotic biosynthesis monooxygenase [Streptomyces fodineus]|uniref:Antibiotic biosynthesis monooxygenase n=1 Tax=Streptomyces fodineus TaxID=1904616 RepID=A0A1D7YD16_9ACTN|nr:antibiotic biosynthesis monooxygenase [Streptomyces fodineus]AOR33370.1 antibiotic biosynthesis monooxygenase [Streptomyces fodineus]
MSDRANAPVQPASLPEPPCYAAIFTAHRTDDDPDGYDRTAAHLSRLVREVPGFLGEDAARTPGGLAVSVAYFRDLAGLAQWRDHPAHLAAKRRGRERWYERYSLHIAKVEHAHVFARE